jgi:hypothetical protein
MSRLLPVLFSLSILTALVVVRAPELAASGAQAKKSNAPEVFTCQAQGRTGAAGAATNFEIQIDSYIAEHVRKSITDALTQGGYPGFVTALRKAPAIGQLRFGGETFTLRWAREQPSGKGRAITIVTDTPVYFVGGGAVNAKPREGFEVAVVQITMDEVGMGSGTMAAAARVKADGQGGVLIEDYAEQPIKLTYVRRQIK